MTKFSSQHGARMVTIALVLLALACGGRTRSEDTDPPGGATDMTTAPPPTCAEICRYVVDSCFPGGAITQCANDCEMARTEYMGCKELTPFLRCYLTARVLCTDKATIDDCYSERDDLVRCKS